MTSALGTMYCNFVENISMRMTIKVCQYYKVYNKFVTIFNITGPSMSVCRFRGEEIMWSPSGKVNTDI